jgi:predicted acetyltransferase/uncharacterized protein YhfF
MTAKELWHEFCVSKGIAEDTPYGAWAFCGGGPTGDELAALVLKGIKFGTASALDDYIYEDDLDELPKVGDYSVILLDNNEAVCVIRDYDVYTRPFGEVSHFHGYSEGEDERTLDAWRRIHTEAFGPDLKEIGYPLTNDSKIVCEKFTVEYIADTEAVKVLLSTDRKAYDIYFIEPTMNIADAIADYRQELLEADCTFDGTLSLKRMPDMQEYVDYVIDRANPIHETPEQNDLVTLLFCVRKSDSKILGSIQIRHEMDEFKRLYSGHIGYSVRPSERRKGYATRILKFAVDYCRTLGIKDINISCMTDNEASRRTILANGGKYRDTVHFHSDQLDIDLERYLI